MRLARQHILSSMRLDFPDLSRGKRKGHGRLAGEDAWLSGAPGARDALRDLVKRLPLDDVDPQFLLCEIVSGRRLCRQTTEVPPLPSPAARLLVYFYINNKTLLFPFHASLRWPPLLLCL